MKLFKKVLTILTIVLVAVMAFSPLKSSALNLTVTGPEDVNITGKKIEVYKLFDITDDGEYTWVEGSTVANFFADTYSYTTVLEATEYVRTLSGTALTTFAEDYYKYCNTKAVEPDGTTTATGNKATFTGLAKGYYLVYDVVGTTVGKSVAILRNLTDNASVELKIETVDKPGKVADKTSANVGEKVTFTVTSAVPNTTGYTTYTFIINDTMSKGLNFNNDVVVKIGGKVYNNYTVEAKKDEATEETKLTITFDEEEFIKLTADTAIEITYSAIINSKAAIEIENTNQVEIEYSNDPTTDSTGKTEEALAKVYTYALDFTKTNIDNEALNGAKFRLILSDGSYATFDQNGVYTGSTTVEKNATVLVSAGTKIAEDGTEVALGKFSISGLAAGTYILQEIEAPEGYDVPSVGFQFIIADAATEGGFATFTYSPLNTALKGYVTAKQLTSSTAHFQVNILNAHEGDLPSTGGIGTTIFTVAGIVVMLVAVVALVVRNRKND